MGHSPTDHRVLSAHNTTGRSLHAIFDGNTCRSCSMLEKCPVRAPNHRERGCATRDTVGDFRLEITAELRLRDQMYADQQTSQWKERYKIRAGIEATNSELKRSYGIGKLRVRRAAKVLFAVSCKLIACNVKRWAKAHFTFFKGAFQWFICALETLLTNGQGLCPKIIFHAHDHCCSFKKGGLLLRNQYFRGVPLAVLLTGTL